MLTYASNVVGSGGERKKGPLRNRKLASTSQFLANLRPSAVAGLRKTLANAPLPARPALPEATRAVSPFLRLGVFFILAISAPSFSNSATLPENSDSLTRSELLSCCRAARSRAGGRHLFACPLFVLCCLSALFPSR